MSKAKILDALRALTAKLERVPSYAELKAATGISKAMLKRHFRSLSDGLRKAGLEPSKAQVLLRSETLLEDWALVARKMGRLPSSNCYEKAGRYSRAVYYQRFGSWKAIPAQFAAFAEQRGAEEQWRDVLAMIADRKVLEKQVAEDGGSASPEQAEAGMRRRHPVYPERPLLGAPMQFPGMSYEPVNESGVSMLFAMLAVQLGFQIERVQTEFPDVVAVREVQPGKWQRVNIEVEFNSRNFVAHGHPMNGCDVIVCWRHNWEECPVRIEVVELRTVVRGGLHLQR